MKKIKIKKLKKILKGLDMTHMHRPKTFFACGSSAPVRVVKVAQLLGLWGPWQRQVCRDKDCLCPGVMAQSVFFQASCSWQSEGLFGQSFSIAPPIQTLKGLPCLGSVSVARWVRHMEGPFWLGSYSVDQCIRHLKGHPGWGPTLPFFA